LFEVAVDCGTACREANEGIGPAPECRIEVNKLAEIKTQQTGKRIPQPLEE
jgi:hypothetical protein